MSTSCPGPDGAIVDGPAVDESIWRITAGRPTPDELAAVAAVLTAVAGHASRPAVPAPTNGWIAHWRRTGETPTPAPDAWRRGVR